MEVQIYTPVLLIGFNRPDVIKESFSYIRKAMPKKLYVAIDGPRKDKIGEEQLVDEVRRIVKKVDWACETRYKFNEENKGAEVTVSSAVSWVLENEETVIVLEDDIIAPMSFFRFAQEMLEMYKKEEKVFLVSSIQFTPFKTKNPEDYFFAFWGHTWGWATWRRAWEKFDLYIDTSTVEENSIMNSPMLQTQEEKKFILNRVKKMNERGQGNSTWDCVWSHVRFIHGGLTIVPKENLTSNIGIYGLHAKGQTEHHFRRFSKNFVAKIHPARVQQNVVYDQYHFSKYINPTPTLFSRIRRKLIHLLKLSFSYH